MRQEDFQGHSINPSRLSSRDVKGLAEYIQNINPRRIVIMSGAGISTSAGIPDFRSPDTGLYARLERLDLPYAEAVFDISYFREAPGAFYTLAKDIYPGGFYPTISHAFIALLSKKGMLRMHYTQNIDCLDRMAGVPPEKIVEAHGSFATQSCIDCKTQYPDDLMKLAIESASIPHCNVPQCNGLVKPDIVFFGESLPLSFLMNRPSVREADLILVIGTSLSVQPFASLPGEADTGVPRILINNEIVGDFGSRPDDVIILGDCDTGVKKLADALGWGEELEKIWFEVSGKLKKQDENLPGEITAKTNDEILESNIQSLIEEIDTSLKLSQEHTDRVTRLVRKSSLAPLCQRVSQGLNEKEEVSLA